MRVKIVWRIAIARRQPNGEATILSRPLLYKRCGRVFVQFTTYVCYSKDYNYLARVLENAFVIFNSVL